MVILPSQYITLISLILSVAAAALVLVLLGWIREGKKRMEKETNIVDVMAVVEEFRSRQKRLEQAIVDQKVRMEILELRLSKGVMSTGGGGLVSNASLLDPSQSQSHSFVESQRNFESIAADQMVNKQAREMVESGLVKGDKIVLEILEIVRQGHSKVTARDIQSRIGRSREHTARMMNLLYKDGLVLRDVQSRPFTYSVTDLGNRELARIRGEGGAP